MFIAFVGALLVHGASFAGYLVTHLEVGDLFPTLNPDDAFYYYQIAYNFAAGKFSTFDGGISQTNGYHPLWALLITPFYWVFDKEQALFGIKAFEIMLISGCVVLVAAAARLARLHWILLFCLLPLLYGNVMLYHGMEAAAAAFLLGLLILAVCLYVKHPARWKWLLAGVAFALPWVRLEYVAISLVATVATFFIQWSRHEYPLSRASLGELARSPLAVTPVIGACAGIVAYFAYNWLVFGIATPVSSVVKYRWSQSRWEKVGGYSLEQNFEQTLRIGVFDYELLVVLEVCVYLLLIWWLAYRFRRQQDWLLLAFLVGVFALAAGHLAKFVQTVLTMHPMFAYSWYYVPAYLLTDLMIPVRCWIAVHLIRLWAAPRSAMAANLLIGCVVVAGSAYLVHSTRFAYPIVLVDWLSEGGRHGPHPRSLVRHRLIARYLGVFVMDRLLPDGSVVGAWNAGIMGYFSRFPVVNLDGLVNSYEYANAMMEESVGGDDAAGVLDYEQLISKYGITHFADYGRTESHQRKENELIFSGVSTNNRAFRIWARPGRALHAEQELRFNADGSWRVWLIVDGGVAQAFAKSCAADDVAVWRWLDPNRGRHETVVDEWTKTDSGWCWSASSYPRNGKTPEHVDKMTMDDWLRSGAG